MFIAHKDTRYIGEQQVMAIRPPEFTNTWHPIAHSTLITALNTAIGQEGIEILNKRYSLNTSGSKMFGVWELSDSENHGVSGMLGFRNSTDKSFALGLCAGSVVFVCDNLAFSGEFMEFRRHTSGLSEEYLQTQFANIFPKMLCKINTFMEWHNGLKKHNVTDEDFKCLTYDFMTSKILVPSKFSSFLDAYEKEGPGNLFSVHGAVTRMLRENPLGTVANRTAVLNSRLTQFMIAKNYIAVPGSTDVIIDGHVVKQYEFEDIFQEPIGITSWIENE